MDDGCLTRGCGSGAVVVECLRSGPGYFLKVSTLTGVLLMDLMLGGPFITPESKAGLCC